MSKINTTLILTVLTLGGCAAMTPVIEGREHKMITAGFRPQAVRTPAQENMAKNLTSYVITSIPGGTTNKYVYYDPTNCKCIYVGDEQAWGQYQQDKQEFDFAGREVKATPLMGKPLWSWGPWEG